MIFLSVCTLSQLPSTMKALFFLIITEIMGATHAMSNRVKGAAKIISNKFKDMFLCFPRFFLIKAGKMK